MKCDRCGVEMDKEDFGADIVVMRNTQFEPELLLVCEQCLTTLDEVFKDSEIE